MHAQPCHECSDNCQCGPENVLLSVIQIQRQRIQLSETLVHQAGQDLDAAVWTRSRCCSICQLTACLCRPCILYCTLRCRKCMLYMHAYDTRAAVEARALSAREWCLQFLATVLVIRWLQECKGLHWRLHANVPGLRAVLGAVLGAARREHDNAPGWGWVGVSSWLPVCLWYFFSMVLASMLLQQKFVVQSVHSSVCVLVGKLQIHGVVVPSGSAHEQLRTVRYRMLRFRELSWSG